MVLNAVAVRKPSSDLEVYTSRSFLLGDSFYTKLSLVERRLEGKKIGASVYIEKIRDVYLKCNKENKVYPAFLSCMIQMPVDRLELQFVLMAVGM